MKNTIGTTLDNVNKIIDYDLIDTTLDDVNDFIDYGLGLRAKTPQEGVNKYGDVKFADEKNKKYPIDTEEHIRAAWTYINKKKNAAEYSAEELASVKAKIVAAWKDKIDPKGPPSAKARAAGTLHVNDPKPFALRDATAFDLIVEALDTRDATEDRTATIAFSSEAPVPGRTGMEILDHGAGADFSRLNNGAPVLLNHNPYDQIGVVEKAWIGSDRKGRAKIRFSKNAHANEIYQDVKDGIRRNVSVGYDHSDPVAEVGGDSGMPGMRGPLMRISQWQPMELSIVSIPADASVGVNRDKKPEDTKTWIHSESGNNPDPISTKPKQETTMSEPTVQETRDAAIKSERERVSAIQGTTAKLVKMGVTDAGEMEAKAIREGTTAQDYLSESFKLLESKGAVRKASDSGARVGLSDQEVKQFSFTRAIRGLSETASAKDREAAKFERECSDAARAINDGTEHRGTFTIPYDVLRPKAARSALSAIGSDIVATKLLPEDFVEYLYKLTVVKQAGARSLDGLVGNVTIPTQSGSTTGYWLATDISTLTESEPTFGQIALSPHTYTGFAKYSRQLLAQSTPGVEMLVRDDLAKRLAVGLDAAVIDGSGTDGVPRGILNTASLNVASLGTEGGAPTYTAMVDLMGFLMKSNAYKGKLAWLINGEGFETMATTLRNSSSTVPIYIINDPYTQLLGHPIYISENVPNDLTKATTGTNLSAVIFGNFDEVIIAGWGGLDILVDPYSFATNSEIGVYAYQMNDVGIRHIASFAAITDMVTT